MASALFEVKNLEVNVGGKSVLHGIDLEIRAGEVHAIMGRNGAGKTTLSYSLMGHPRYHVTKGDICLDGESLLGLSPDERARKRLFLGFQYPVAIPGVSVANFLRTSVRQVRGAEVSPSQFRALVKKELAELQIPESFMTRYLNEGFSGGEKKRLEILQLKLLNPKIAVLDETDSGLDIDALRIVAENINKLRGEDRGILLITHYQRLLDYIKPDKVHVLLDGKIVKSGNADLALRLEKEGYDWIV